MKNNMAIDFCQRQKGIVLIALMLLAPATEAAANLAVTAFSCNPNEVVAGSQFSCAATVQNTGDATGTVNTAALYPDSNNWMENSNYPETANTNINSGASLEVVFNSLRAKKSGNNGFSKIMLDDVTDTYAADSGTKVNAIDVVGTVTSSASSAASGASVTVTGQATAGGNVDITLTFSVVSGSCSIGSQPAAATSSGMSNGQTTSHTWTVTAGSSDCTYSVAAKATSKPAGTATKTDTTTNTMTCSSGCATTTTVASDSSSSSSGGGGGGGSSSNATTNATANKTAATAGTAGSACTQSWDCSPWSECINSAQSRTCTDKNDCAGKKASGLVAKIEEVQKPAERQSCIPLPKEISALIQAVKDYSIWIVIFVITAIVLGYLYYHGHHHVKKAAKLIYDYREQNQYDYTRQKKKKK